MWSLAAQPVRHTHRKPEQARKRVHNPRPFSPHTSHHPGTAPLAATGHQGPKKNHSLGSALEAASNGEERACHRRAPELV